MRESATTHPTTKSLSSMVRQHATGRLVVTSSAGRIRVYTRNGEIIAAESGSDERLLLRRLFLEGVLSKTRARAYFRMFKEGEAIFPVLVEEVRGPTLQQVLEDRFRDNLCLFVGSHHKPIFQEVRTILVDNIQMGHPPGILIRRACDTWDTAVGLDGKIPLRINPQKKPSTPEEQNAIKLLSEGPRPIAELVSLLALEPISSRAMIAQMMDSGLLRTESDQDQPKSDGAKDGTQKGALKQASQGDAPKKERKSRSNLPPNLSPDSMTGFQKWLLSTDQVEDSELAAFADPGQQPIEAQAGSFTTQHHHLDRIGLREIEDALEVGGTEGLVEDVLDDDIGTSSVAEDPIVVEKLDALNEFLILFGTCFDKAIDPNHGREQIKNLLAFCAAQYPTLYADLPITNRGSVPKEAFLERTHPMAEEERGPLLDKALIALACRAQFEGKLKFEDPQIKQLDMAAQKLKDRLNQ